MLNNFFYRWTTTNLLLYFSLQSTRLVTKHCRIYFVLGMLKTDIVLRENCEVQPRPRLTSGTSLESHWPSQLAMRSVITNLVKNAAVDLT